MRGDIYRLRPPTNPGPRGHEQIGPRYAVIIQSDALLLSTLLIAPTSRSAIPSLIHPVIEMDGTRCVVLLDQIRAVDGERLGDFAGRLDPHEMAEIDQAVRLVTGL